jgi:TRAP-type mannitol/chloroaromatic compound transport system substrate-binding protein
LWEGSAQLSVYVNAKQWASLPKPYQEALEVACAEGNVNMMARYDAKNTEALRRLVGAGAQLRAFPRPVMEACYNVAQDLYAEFSAKNAEFKKIYTSWSQFRDDQYLWFRVAENTFDNFVYSIRKPKK